jgi:hypothetical protein
MELMEGLEMLHKAIDRMEPAILCVTDWATFWVTPALILGHFYFPPFFLIP